MISENILEIPPFISNQYLVKGQNGYLLIDTGLPNSYTKITKYLLLNGISLSEIELIVITHADADHFGGLPRIQADRPSIISSSSLIEAEAIRKGESSRKLKKVGIKGILASLLWSPFRSKLAHIERILEIGEELPYMGGLEIIDSSGHTPGHISLWSKTTRTLFCGDSISIHGKTLSPSTGYNTWNLEKARISFEIQLSLNPDRIYAGHGTWQRA
jgi:glyoxylase-like metal-dependent hydrolase (beta-lactamase superfamily II)